MLQITKAWLGQAGCIKEEVGLTGTPVRFRVYVPHIEGGSTPSQAIGAKQEEQTPLILWEKLKIPVWGKACLCVCVCVSCLNSVYNCW